MTAPVAFRPGLRAGDLSLVVPALNEADRLTRSLPIRASYEFQYAPTAWARSPSPARSLSVRERASSGLSPSVLTSEGFVAVEPAAVRVR